MGLKDVELLESLLDIYKGLGKRGKPLPHEHTSLAGIAVEFDSSYSNKDLSGRFVFLALATGTKCIAASARDGYALNDGHGEILARRVVVRWLVDEIRALYDGHESLVLQIQGGATCVSLRKGVSFHLVITSPPCGDCAVLCDQSGEHSNKRHRTGAKIIRRASEIPQADAVENYAASQVSGVVRRKPGRGDPTSSVSCSDKILKWNILGFQGCLLRSLMDRSIYFGSITIAYVGEGPGHASDIESKAVHRALWQRAFLDGNKFQYKGMPTEPPEMHAVVLSREVMVSCGLCESEAQSSSSGVSAMWWAKPSHQWRVIEKKVSSQIPRGSRDNCEIVVGKSGYKMGSPKMIPKDDVKLAAKSSSRFSRAALWSKIDDILRNRGICIDSEVSYSVYKATVCPDYFNSWQSLRNSPSLFSKWIVKNTS